MDAAILKQLDKSSNSTDSWLKDGEINSIESTPKTPFYYKLLQSPTSWG